MNLGSVSHSLSINERVSEPSSWWMVKASLNQTPTGEFSGALEPSKQICMPI